MDPVARVALWLGAIAALSALARPAPDAPDGASSPRAAASGPGQPLVAACGPGTLPDDGVCIPVPRLGVGAPELEAAEGSHRDASGRTRTYEHIPRRPERPDDYRRYRFPVPLLPGQSFVSSGYDLHLPGSNQRQGLGFSTVGHGGVDVAQARGTEVRAVALEGQEGDAEVVFTGELFGASVVTLHAVRAAGRVREYVVIHGHLEAAAPGLLPGTPVREGTLLGSVGDTGSPGIVHLHLEVRQVREKVAIRSVAGGALARSEHSVVCDPRNVLPLR
ncbi:MAG: M23 family metallopeptidase [Polyangiaceae bacterium]|nr:M23 family metallopeptidase [Polyangiaceae bacterium]